MTISAEMSRDYVNVKFSKCGKWLYSVGGLDKAVFQFEVKGGTGAGATAATSFSTGISAMATTTSSASSSLSSKAATKPSKGRKSRTS